MHLQISRFAHIQTDLQRGGGGGGGADRQIDIIALSNCQSGGAIVNVSSPLLFQLEERHTHSTNQEGKGYTTQPLDDVARLLMMMMAFKVQRLFNPVLLSFF